MHEKGVCKVEMGSIGLVRSNLGEGNMERVK